MNLHVIIFSKYYFHRIFSAVMNETLFDFIQRTRTEKAAYILLSDRSRPDTGKMVIAGWKYAIARFLLSSDEFQEAWSWVYGTWLTQSGYQPDDSLCFELYPEEAKDGKFTVDICVPVKPLKKTDLI